MDIVDSATARLRVYVPKHVLTGKRFVARAAHWRGRGLQNSPRAFGPKMENRPAPATAPRKPDKPSPLAPIRCVHVIDFRCARRNSQSAACHRRAVRTTPPHRQHLRLASMEAETRTEERRLTTEYGRLWKSIRPCVVEDVLPYKARIPDDKREEHK
jgi:hypothetical protein